ncbi:MAG: transcriptional regulator [Spirochaetales bacterium]|nr:transcriptional regulator [Spirochaetales bacterium]
MDNSLTEICRSVSQLHTDEIELFFREILSEKEIEDVQLRWELMKKLKKGESQRNIAKDLHISLCKITRGVKILKQPNGVINRILSKEQAE